MDPTKTHRRALGANLEEDVVLVSITKTPKGPKMSICGTFFMEDFIGRTRVVKSDVMFIKEGSHRYKFSPIVRTDSFDRRMKVIVNIGKEILENALCVRFVIHKVKPSVA
ncbi:unnamed protein product [Prunus armeniaca]